MSLPIRPQPRRCSPPLSKCTPESLAWGGGGGGGEPIGSDSRSLTPSASTSRCCGCCAPPPGGPAVSAVEEGEGRTLCLHSSTTGARWVQRPSCFTTPTRPCGHAPVSWRGTQPDGRKTDRGASLLIETLLVSTKPFFIIWLWIDRPLLSTLCLIKSGLLARPPEDQLTPTDSLQTHRTGRTNVHTRVRSEA